MQLDISNFQLESAGMDEAQLKLELAVFLFEKNIFTLGKAAEFCGLHKMQMQQELAKREISLHYTEEMFDQDLEVIKKGL
jgi:predicted HTH domain antitoxin